MSFAEAAKDAVRKAEEERGDDAPREYEATFRVTGEPGSSLSEYIAILHASG
ncbi:MAG TPA: hypothetical protein VGJ40_03170 [Gaiellaceae bacterium]